MPPMTPEPSHIIQSWWVTTPTAEMSRPPHQHSAETTPALRGPTRSSQPPHSAADEPRTTKNNVYIQPRSLTFQSQLVVNRAEKSVVAAAQGTDWLRPMAWVNGSQKTLNPYAMPMHK